MFRISPKTNKNTWGTINLFKDIKDARADDNDKLEDNEPQFMDQKKDAMWWR